MGDRSNIEWTDATWNPVRGCTKVSAGCKNCYAETFAERWRGIKGHPFEQGFDLRLVPEKLLEPLRWQRPRKIFVNSMSDLFHDDVPFEYIAAVFGVMALAQRHTFQILTKRPARARLFFAWVAREAASWASPQFRFLNATRPPIAAFCVSRLADRTGDVSVDLEGGLPEWPLPNVWIGVSVEDQKAADTRIPELLQLPAAIRFLSCEPLLAPVDLFAVPRPDNAYFHWRGETGAIGPKSEPDDYVYWQKRAIHWVIVGGESGRHARPMHPEWARALRDQCAAAGVPFFFKQWGEWAPGENVERSRGSFEVATFFDGKWVQEVESLSRCDGHVDDQPDAYRIGKKAAGRSLDGRTWDEFPEVRA